VYFTSRSELVLQDVSTFKRRMITGTLPYPPDLLWSLVAAPDGRTLYYGARHIEANIWLVKRSASAARAP
jgi:hypothetical protein